MNKTTGTRLLAVLCSIISHAAIAGGDPVRGAELAKTCASCHGLEGVSAAPNFPILAGQYADYIVRALKDYKSGERDNAIMKGFAAGLSDQDMQDLAAWFASQNGGLVAPRITNP